MGGVFLKCIRTASVKHVLTEAKKEQLKQEFERDLWQIRTELSQLEFQLQRALKAIKNTTSYAEVQKKYKNEIKQREERADSLEFRMNQLISLPLGTELGMGNTEIILDLKEGDKWIAEDANVAIIIKDGLIAEIRESEKKENDKLV